MRQCREAHSDVEPQPQSSLSCNEQLLHTVSLSCLDGNYLLFNSKINYIAINWQFTHWGNAYTCFNIIPCQKVDDASSICQTNFITLPSLKVRLPTVCHEDQCVESSGHCWLVSSVFLGPAMYYLDDTGEKNTGRSTAWKQLQVIQIQTIFQRQLQDSWNYFPYIFS